MQLSVTENGTRRKVMLKRWMGVEVSRKSSRIRQQQAEGRRQRRCSLGVSNFLGSGLADSEEVE